MKSSSTNATIKEHSSDRKPSRLPLTLENTKRRPSTGVSTEDIDEGDTGGTGGVNPVSSNEKPLITENTKKAMMKENRELKTKFAAPPPYSQKIRKSHYVFILYIYYDIIHKYKTLNVNKVNSEEIPVVSKP